MRIITFDIPNWLAIITLINRLNSAMTLADPQHDPIEAPKHKHLDFDLEVIEGGFLADFIKAFTVKFEGEDKTIDTLEVAELVSNLEESKPRINEVDEMSYDCLLMYLNGWLSLYDDIGLEGLEFKWRTSEWPEGEEFEHPWVMTASMRTVSVKQGEQVIKKEVLIENGDWISPALDLSKTLKQNPSD